MFFLLFALATFSVDSATELSRTNEALRQVLRELQVGDVKETELTTWKQMYDSVGEDQKSAFVSDFKALEKGKCYGKQGSYIDCKAAAEALGQIFYKSGRSSKWPTGCLWSEKQGKFWYNTRRTSKSAESKKVLICPTEAQMKDESSVGQKKYYGLTKDKGSCKAGKALTEEQCKNEVSFGEKWGGSGLFGNSWWNKESCGCYLDQNGKRYFNTQTNTHYCRSDYGEKLICIVPPPPKTCHNTFKFLETDDGKCSTSLTFPSNSCPKGYRKIMTVKECQDLVTKGAKNIHWRGSHSPRETNWPKGCVVYKRGSSSFYQAYFNTKSSDCHKCDKEIAPLCKLV